MTKQKKQVTTETVKEQVDYTTMSPDELFELFGNWSKAIRALSTMGFKRGDVARMLGKKYQHVRNVLITPLTGK